jgi:hypothetical protein
MNMLTSLHAYIYSRTVKVWKIIAKAVPYEMLLNYVIYYR